MADSPKIYTTPDADTELTPEAKARCLRLVKIETELAHASICWERGRTSDTVGPLLEAVKLLFVEVRG